MKKNKIIVAIILANLLILFSCKVDKNGKIVDKFELTTNNQYVFIDNDGDENTIENILYLYKKDLENYPDFKQLEKGSQLKYKSGGYEWVYLNDVLEIDGVKQR